MNNADTSAMPNITPDMKVIGGTGLTKREYFCLKMGVTETGDEELDAIIKKGVRQKIAGLALQGYIAAGGNGMPVYNLLAEFSDKATDALLKELEK